MTPQPDEPKPRSPGEYIRDELKARGWTQEDLARILDRPLPTVNEIIQGRRAVMPEMAITLGLAFGTTAELWVQREAAFRLSLATPPVGDDVRRRAKIYSMAPIKELQKRGWVRSGDDIGAIEQDLLKLFGIAHLDEEPAIVGSMRKTHPTVLLTPAQRVWVARVRQIAGSQKVGTYDEKRVEDCRRELRKLASYSGGVSKVPLVLAKFGIRFTVVEPLSGGRVDGVATWLNEASPVIGMSARFDRIDSFWFTLGHELTHIKHRDEAPLDGDVNNHDVSEAAAKSPVEQRADEEAAATFISPDELQSFILRVGPLYSKERINQFANRIKIHPGLIVGQLQHRGEIGYSANKEMLVKVRHAVTAVTITDGWGHTIDPRSFT